MTIFRPATLHFTTQSRARNKRGATSASLECDRARRWARPRDTKRAATERKDETEPCRGLPPRPHSSPMTPARRPLLARLEAKRFGRWPPRTTRLPTTESKGETKDEAQQRLAASAFVLRGTAAPLGAGCWSFRSARRRGGSRRADCLSLSSERTMGLAERTAHGACRENRPQ